MAAAQKKCIIHFERSAGQLLHLTEASWTRIRDSAQKWSDCSEDLSREVSVAI